MSSEQKVTPKPSIDIINAIVASYELEIADIDEQLEKIRSKELLLVERRRVIEELYKVASSYSYLKK